VTDHPSRSWPIHIRLGRPDDRDAIVAFATNTWDGWDYIPSVIDRWLVPADGIVLVATVAPPRDGGPTLDANGERLDPETVVAMTRVTMLSATEAWLEGIRVDPRVRGLEVGTDLQVAELHWIAAHNANVVRYITTEVNTGSLKLGARHGLVEVGRWRSRARRDDHDDSSEHVHVTSAVLEPLTGAIPADWGWLSDDPTFSAAHHLYEYRDWAFQELTEDRFLGHIERREAFVAKGERPGSRALLILNAEVLEGGHVEVSYLAGDADAALRLLEPLGFPDVRLPDPLPAPLVSVETPLERAGLIAWPHAAVIVERPMDAAHPLPAIDPSRLVLEDTPRALAVARPLG
jgi:hypothetical protein